VDSGRRISEITAEMELGRGKEIPTCSVRSDTVRVSETGVKIFISFRYSFGT
jgi:hypothetical protein